MVTAADKVISTIPKTVELHKHNTTTEQNPPEADHYCGRGNGKPKMVTLVVTSTTYKH